MTDWLFDPDATIPANTLKVGDTIQLRARNTDPDTSHAAARDARAGAAAVRTRCLEALRNAGARGLTDFELADLVGSQQTSAGRRRLDLVRLGLVEDSKQRRPAPSGSDAIVWRSIPQ